MKSDDYNVVRVGRLKNGGKYTINLDEITTKGKKQQQREDTINNMMGTKNNNIQYQDDAEDNINIDRLAVKIHPSKNNNTISDENLKGLERKAMAARGGDVRAALGENNNRGIVQIPNNNGTIRVTNHGAAQPCAVAALRNSHRGGGRREKNDNLGPVVDNYPRKIWQSDRHFELRTKMVSSIMVRLCQISTNSPHVHDCWVRFPQLANCLEEHFYLSLPSFELYADLSTLTKRVVDSLSPVQVRQNRFAWEQQTWATSAAAGIPPWPSGAGLVNTGWSQQHQSQHQKQHLQETLKQYAADGSVVSPSRLPRGSVDTGITARREAAWASKLESLKRYAEDNGDCSLSREERMLGRSVLATWRDESRQRLSNPTAGSMYDDVHINKLEAGVGFNWDADDRRGLLDNCESNGIDNRLVSTKPGPEIATTATTSTTVKAPHASTGDDNERDLLDYCRALAAQVVRGRSDGGASIGTNDRVATTELSRMVTTDVMPNEFQSSVGGGGGKRMAVAEDSLPSPTLLMTAKSCGAKRGRVSCEEFRSDPGTIDAASQGQEEKRARIDDASVGTAAQGVSNLRKKKQWHQLIGGEEHVQPVETSKLVESSRNDVRLAVAALNVLAPQNQQKGHATPLDHPNLKELREPSPDVARSGVAAPQQKKDANTSNKPALYELASDVNMVLYKELVDLGVIPNNFLSSLSSLRSSSPAEDNQDGNSIRNMLAGFVSNALLRPSRGENNETKGGASSNSRLVNPSSEIMAMPGGRVVNTQIFGPRMPISDRMGMVSGKSSSKSRPGRHPMPSGTKEHCSGKEVGKPLPSSSSKSDGNLVPMAGKMHNIDPDPQLLSASSLWSEKKPRNPSISTPRVVQPKPVSKRKFPHRLFTMLNYIDENPEWNTAVSWSANGRAFFIHNREKLVEILPKFFMQTQFKSFTRQLNLWGFERILPNGWFSEHFVRGNDVSCLGRLTYVKVKGGEKGDGPRKAKAIRVAHMQKYINERLDANSSKLKNNVSDMGKVVKRSTSISRSDGDRDLIAAVSESMLHLSRSLGGVKGGDCGSGVGHISKVAGGSASGGNIVQDGGRGVGGNGFKHPR